MNSEGNGANSREDEGDCKSSYQPPVGAQGKSCCQENPDHDGGSIPSGPTTAISLIRRDGPILSIWTTRCTAASS